MMAEGRKTSGRSKATPNPPSTRAAAAPAAPGRGAAPPPNTLAPRRRARETAPAPAPAPDPPKRGRGRPANPENPGLPRYKLVRVADLKPYPNNARTHTAAQIAKIVASVKEFGFTNPILTDGRRGIVAGHGRLQAAVLLDMDTVPTIELSHLTAAQRRAYVIADNKLALEAGWDEELLALELGELQAAGFDLALTGFDPAELAGLLEEPEAPEAPAVRTTKKTIECPRCHHTFPG